MIRPSLWFPVRRLTDADGLSVVLIRGWEDVYLVSRLPFPALCCFLVVVACVCV